MNLTLRCNARVCDDQWHAICTDLDVAADGASLEEAKTALTACIELYLEDVNDMSATDRHRLLTRRAPWHVRAKMACLSYLQKPQGVGATSLGFVLEPHFTCRS